jgi:N-acetylmuramoyl-L-alanine amidase
MTKQFYLYFGDDGHGIGTRGKETPFIPELGRKIKENEFNREVIKRLKTLFDDTEVIFVETAPGDTDVPLGTRVATANRIYKDYCDKYGKENVHAVFVSVHFNALAATFNDGYQPEGFSVHIQPGSIKSVTLAEKMIEQMKNGRTQRNRGIVYQNLYVTRETHMPAALSENGFMDNERESLWMIDAAFQQETADEHFLAAMDYFGLDASEEVTPVSKPVEAPEPEPEPKPEPKPVPAGTAVSVVDYLNARGQASSFSARAKLAAKHGIKGRYTGSPEQNLALLAKLQASAAPKTPQKLYKDVDTDSIVDFLRANGVDPRFSNRAKLAVAYGIQGFEGTAAQNTKLLALLRAATVQAAPKGDQETGSIVKYLKSIGQPSSFDYRAKLAVQFGIQGYKGTAAQNTKLLNLLRK